MEDYWSTHAPRAWERSASPVTDLGPAIRSVNARSVGFGHLPDGEPIVFVLSNGDPVTFTVAHATTGTRLFSKGLFGATLGSWVVQDGTDGDIYLAVRDPTPAGLHRFDVREWQLHHVQDRIGGETGLHSGCVDRSGVLWFGTSPRAKLMSYDPRSNRIRDLGSQTDDAAFLYAVGVVGDRIWAGTGPVPHLFVVDPVTGTQTEMHPPPHVMAGTEWFINIDQRNADVLVRLAPRGAYDTAIHHTRTGEWHREVIPGTHGGAPTPVAADGTTYVLGRDEAHRTELIGYRTHARRIVRPRLDQQPLPAQVIESDSSYGIGLLRAPELGLPNQSVVGMNPTGELWFRSLTTKHTRVITADIPARVSQTHSIGAGPDGHMYIGGFLSGGAMSRLDADTLALEALRGPRQIDAVITHRDRLVISSCPGAEIHIGDPARPWDWGHNPCSVLAVGRHRAHLQERAVALAAAGDLIAIGTIPAHGRLGGSLTLLDPVTGRSEVHDHVVPNQSVTSLAHRAGLLYGATSVFGGVASTAVEPEGRLFVWDIARAEKVWEGSVSPGAAHVGGLAWGPDGLVGTTSNGDLFTFDPDAFRVTRLVSMLPRSHRVVRWESAHTVHDPDTDCYLATQSDRLVRVRRHDWSVDVLSSTMAQIARAPNGRIFAVDHTNAYLIRP